MKKFDVCVIGGGPAGYAAAMRAIDFGKRVALIEKDKLGGAGIHQGALWSKTWWEISREARMINLHGPILNVDMTDFRFEKVKSLVSEAVDQRVDLLTHHLKNINLGLEVDLFEYFHGTGTVTGRNLVSITGNGQDQEIEAEAGHEDSEAELLLTEGSTEES